MELPIEYKEKVFELLKSEKILKQVHKLLSNEMPKLDLNSLSILFDKVGAERKEELERGIEVTIQCGDVIDYYIPENIIDRNDSDYKIIDRMDNDFNLGQCFREVNEKMSESLDYLYSAKWNDTRKIIEDLAR